MEDNREIFDGKTFKDLTKDIYVNSTQKQKQINQLIQEIHQYITTIDDVILVAPVIKELMDVSVKNDEHLVKLASVLQRIIVKSEYGINDDTITLSEQEKEELIQTLQETATEVQKENDKMHNLISTTKSYIEG